MWSISKRDRYIRSTLLTITSIVCISLVIICVIQSGIKQKIIQKVSKEDAIVSERQIEEECIPVCDSRECIFQTNILLKSINPDVRPCENFQKFLCGGFEQTIGPNESGSSGISKAHMMMLHKIKDILENIAAPPGTASSKLKTMYDSCVNTGSSDLRSIEDFKQVLNNVGILNWPHLPENFTLSEAGLPVLLGTLKPLTAMYFFQIILQESRKEDSDTKITRVYYNHYAVNYTTIARDAAADILKYFDIGKDDIKTILSEYDRVENTFANLYNENYTKCKENCEVHIDCSSPEDKAWEYVCETVEVFLNLTHLNDYRTKLEVVVRLENTFAVKNFIPCLKSLPGRSVANYFALNFLWNHLGEVNFFFRRQKQKHYQHFKTDLKPKMEIKSRWMYCIEWIAEYMKLPLGNEYVQKYLGKSIIDEVLEIHTNYTTEVGDMIAQQEWISVEPRSSVEHLVKDLKSNLFQLKEIFPNETLVNEYMKMFNPTLGSFFLNVLDYKRMLMNLYLSQPSLERLVNRIPPFEVEAVFDDEIGYFFGILFPPFYHPGHKSLLNRVTFVPIIVHEIGHGVVEHLSYTLESSNSTKKIFAEKKHCIENQFSKFEFKYLGENLNGTRYLGENLADNFAQAFTDKLLENFESSPDAFSLPGLHYSPKQQLYMSAKQEFCSKSNLKDDIYYKTEDRHAPSEYRIIGTMQNSKGYAEAFHCPEESYMNPNLKCSLFD